MPIFSSLLLLFAALAFMSLALLSTGLARERRQHTRDEEKMTLGALVCESAARNAFGVELDHSMDSIANLDALISQGWSGATANSANEPADELVFVLASYLGDVFVRHSGAFWRQEGTGSSIGFRKINIVADPFDLIERKINDTENVHLQAEASQLLQELERLWHPVINLPEAKIG